MKAPTPIRRTVLGLLGAAALATCGLASAQTTLEKLREQGFIRVGFANEAPYSYANASGQLTGESPTVFKHVMQKLGVKEVDGVLTEWGALIPGLKAGRFDAIVASMYITPKRCEQIIFAEPTYGVGEALVVKTGNPDGVSTYADAVSKGKSIAFVAGTAEIEHGKLAGMKREQQMVVPDFAAAVAAVKAGRASAAAFTSLTAKDLAGKDDGLERAQPFTFTHDGKIYKGEGSFGFRPEDTSLRDAVNAELAKFIGTEQHLAMVAKFGFDKSNLPEKTAAQHCAGD
ncbi:ectoine/hydroxyectoine ABC transporter substrate-binding protein EhuB [Hydrogenophaga sp.]|uniref:ectoine/hydroxyectoine ABC transporter substrate-binding protein EhuB n=1 Tax=Hydrogenophaga sp. TaxID=1904254 RepID=UPI003D14EC13